MKSESSELLRAELNDLRRMSTHLNESLKNCADYPPIWQLKISGASVSRRS